MADNKYSGDNWGVSGNDDYLELLNSLDNNTDDDSDSDSSVVAFDTYEDIYSDSGKKADEYEDVYSNSTAYGDDYPDVYSSLSTDSDDYSDIFSNSAEDIYIKRPAQSNTQNADIYINRKRSDIAERFDGASVRHSNHSAPSAPPAPKKKRLENIDEISDYEARRGKLVPQKKKPAGLIIIAILLAVVIALGGMLFSVANSIVGNFIEAEPIEHIANVDTLVTDKNVRNVLLIGVDKEKGGSSRSDSIMIASVNKTTGRITVCSILRDTHLDIPGECEAKVNSAYAWGGANLLVQTIEENFRIRIDDYATVNFEMFTALVDGLGGIEVEVTEDEADYINNRHRYGKEQKPDHFESGESVHLNGYQALWYSRIRKLDSDFYRTARQRKVITSIMEKVKGQLNPVGVFGLIDTAKQVAPYIETTLSFNDFCSLALSLASCLGKSGTDMDKLLVSQKIPFDDTWWFSSQWDGSSISIDLEENRERLHTLLYEAPEVAAEEESTDNVD